MECPSAPMSVPTYRAEHEMVTNDNGRIIVALSLVNQSHLKIAVSEHILCCLLYTSDAADE